MPVRGFDRFSQNASLINLSGALIRVLIVAVPRNETGIPGGGHGNRHRKARKSFGFVTNAVRPVAAFELRNAQAGVAISQVIELLYFFLQAHATE